MASKQLSHLKKVNRQSLQLEVKLVARLLYKNKNQRRREKDFQKLRKLQKLADRISKSPVVEAMERLVKGIKLAVKKSGAGVVEEESSTVLTDMASYAKLVKYTISFCEETYRGIAGQLAMALFVPFTLTMAAAISRIWVCLRFILIKVDKIDRSVQDMSKQLETTSEQSGCLTPQRVSELPEIPSAYSTGSYTLEMSWIDSNTCSQLKREACSDDTGDDDLGEPIALDWSANSNVVEDCPVALTKNRSTSRKFRSARSLKAFQVSKRKSKLLHFHKMLNKPCTAVQRYYSDHNRTAAFLPKTSESDKNAHDTIDDIFSVLD